jgi:hypothetical protein
VAIRNHIPNKLPLCITDLLISQLAKHKSRTIIQRVTKKLRGLYVLYVPLTDMYKPLGNTQKPPMMFKTPLHKVPSCICSVEPANCPIFSGEHDWACVVVSFGERIQREGEQDLLDGCVCTTRVNPVASPSVVGFDLHTDAKKGLLLNIDIHVNIVQNM